VLSEHISIQTTGTEEDITHSSMAHVSPDSELERMNTEEGNVSDEEDIKFTPQDSHSVRPPTTTIPSVNPNGGIAGRSTSTCWDPTLACLKKAIVETVTGYVYLLDWVCLLLKFIY
jgi:hypothetical protein